MSNLLNKIGDECSEYIDLSQGNYAQKPLSFDGKFIKKVKVRKKKSGDDFATLFDEAFYQEYKDIMRRSVLCNGIHLEPERNREQYYVFPLNGFRTLYNPEIDYYREYVKIYENLQKSMDVENAKKTFIDMIEYSYKDNDFDLSEALFSGNEIIFYGIPYFYAIKKEKHPDYSLLLKMICNS